LEPSKRRLAGRRNPPLPAELEPSYLAAMATMHKLVFDLSAEPWGTTLAQCIMAWQLAAKGYAEAAERITELPWPRDGERK
jgi:hypothetical protein